MIRRPDNATNGFPGGINNTVEETAVPSRSVRQAVNVSATDAGKFRRRRGYTLRIAGRASSLFSSMQGMFAVLNGDLNLYDDDLNGDTLLSEMPEIPVSYTETPRGVYWMNKVSAGMVENGELLPFWPESPGQPILSVASTGGLDAGRYQVAVTYADSLGRESGTTIAPWIDVATGQGIALSLPTAPAGAVRTKVYMTGANDDELALVREFDSATTSLTLGRSPRGIELETQHLDPLPIGQIVRLFNGRLLVASGRWLHFSEQYRYGLTRPGNHIGFSGDITMIAPTASGVFIAASKRTIWLGGTNPNEWGRKAVYAAGAVPNTQGMAPMRLLVRGSESDEMLPYWLASDGRFLLGRPDGSVEFMAPDFVAPEGAESGATLVRQRMGVKELITTVLGGAVNRAMASDEVVGTVRRNGVEI